MIEVTNAVFLCGGEPALAISAERLVAALRGGRAALLLQGGANVQKYVPRYVEPWLACGLAGFDLVAPDETGVLDEDRALEVIASAGGVFVGGGNTARYRQLYATGLVGELIRRRCREGLAYGGLSAGMLIAGEICPLAADETGESEVRLAAGLGLFGGVLFEPHFTSRDGLPRLREGLRLSGMAQGYGVADDACVVLRPGCEMEVLGTGVTRVDSSMYN